MKSAGTYGDQVHLTVHVSFQMQFYIGDSIHDVDKEHPAGFAKPLVLQLEHLHYFLQACVQGKIVKPLHLIENTIMHTLDPCLAQEGEHPYGAAILPE